MKSKNSLALALSSAVLVLLLSSCGGANDDRASRSGRERGTGLKVALVGIDGASFTVLDPLLDRGQAPAFERIAAEGARATLASREPMVSAALWTTIATGKPREVHGIERFKNERDELVGSTDREVLALWNLMAPFGKTSGIVSWWATWPAEPVPGWMVSDRLTRGRFTEWFEAERGGSLTAPPSLLEELLPLVVEPAEAPMGELAALGEFSERELAEMAGATEPIFAHGPSVLKFAYCAQRTAERVALRQLRGGQPDLFGVYLVAVDPASHTFWHYYRPDDYPPGSVDPGAARRLGPVIPNLYRHNDAFLAELLAALGPDTVVIVVSDHGFRSGSELPGTVPAREVGEHFDEHLRKALGRGEVTVGQPGVHSPEGIFLAVGGPILPGAATEATILDVAPTVLALLGLPVPSDMPGRVLEEIVDPGFWKRYPIRHIDTYEGLVPRNPAETPALPEDEEQRKMLRALGYIE